MLRPEPGRRSRRGPQVVRSFALNGLFVLACLYTVAIGRPFLQPLVIAFLLYFLLDPLVRLLVRWRVPRTLGATLVVMGLLGLVATGLYHLARPAEHWMSQAPQSLRQLERRAREVAVRFEEVSRTARQVDELTDVGRDDTPQVTLKGPGLSATVFGGLQTAASDALVIFTLVFFLLVSGDLFLRKALRLVPRTKDKRAAVDIARELERSVSAYILMTTAINVGFGAVVGVVVGVMGLPNPLLWGVVAGVTNFVPYIGAVACAVALGLAATLTFPDPWHALTIPAVFMALNVVEGYLVTPLVMGRKLMLNTPVLFIGLLFWWWVWGITGTLLAVPIMATIKIVADNIDRLEPLADFMGDD